MIHWPRRDISHCKDFPVSRIHDKNGNTVCLFRLHGLQCKLRGLGFTGGDNQGIIGLEVIYEEYLQGESGTILTVTDAKGVEVAEAGEERVEPIDGQDLYISLDMNIQSYATQLASVGLTSPDSRPAAAVMILNVDPGS